VKWLLDTNVVSEGIRPLPNRAVVRWIAARSPEQVAISIVTLAELSDGATSIASKQRRDEFLQWIETHIMGSFEDRTLPLTSEILVDWLRLTRKLAARGKPRVAVDLLVAATARIHDLIIVSRNVKHFALTGVLVYDPWTGDTHSMDSP